jgi:uncharacterized SAM-binding protein YcdF (DUF218 family)
VVRRSVRLRLFLLCVVLVFVAFFARSRWLPWIARPLVEDDGPVKADVAVVLAGDANGYRIEKAASLVREGYVPRILVSGPAYYGIHECDLAIAYAVSQGHPKEWFVPLPLSAHSTKEESGVILEELRRRNVQTFLLVTSNYHSARAGRIFRAALRESGGGPSMRVVPSPDPYFQPDGWWTNREGQKTLFFEWSKSVAGAMGM